MKAFLPRFALLFASVLPSGCSDSPDVTAAGAGRDDVGIASTLTSDISGLAGEQRPKLSISVRQEKVYEAWHLEFATEEACAAYNPPGGRVFSRFQKWADVFVPENSLRVLSLAGGVVWMDQGRSRILPPPPAPEPIATRGTPELIARGGVSGFKGKGVIIAVVDSGLDFRHPDFIVPDAEGRPVSRLLYLWDTSSDAHDRKGLGNAAPITYPNGSSVGTLYTREQLTSELRSLRRQIPPTDLNGHGTACAGIAAGNGRVYPDLRYSGVAPEADLIGVRVGGSADKTLENPYLLGAICGWLDSVAGKQPLVVSCSYGEQDGGRDGSVVLERQLDARFAAPTRGRAICIAAGNERTNGLHAEAAAGAEDKAGSISWEVPAGSAAEVKLYTSTDAFADLSLSWTGKDKPPPTQHRKILHRLSKNVLFKIQVGPGSYGVKVVSESGAASVVDAYIQQLVQDAPELRFSTNVTMAKQVGSPATALQAITVGSYDFNDLLEVKAGIASFGKKSGDKVIPLTMGALSDYSNPGPRRTGDAFKPELVAPGEIHTAPLAQDNVAMAKGTVEKSGKYVPMDGTSSATPYCAGVVALMFQKNPNLTVGEVKRILQASLTRDLYTGRTPNGAWGYGKLDLKAVRAALAAVK